MTMKPNYLLNLQLHRALLSLEKRACDKGGIFTGPTKDSLGHCTNVQIKYGNLIRRCFAARKLLPNLRHDVLLEKEMFLAYSIIGLSLQKLKTLRIFVADLYLFFVIVYFVCLLNFCQQ